MHLLSAGTRNGVTGKKGNISFWDATRQLVVNPTSTLEQRAARLCPGMGRCPLAGGTASLALLPERLCLWNIQLI